MGLWDGTNAAAGSPRESPDYFPTPEKLSGTSGMSPRVYFAAWDGVSSLTDSGLLSPLASETKARAELGSDLISCTLIPLVLPWA